MDKRTVTTGAVACVLGIVVVGVWRGDLHEPSIAAVAEPSSTPARSLPARPTTAVGNDKIQIALLVDTSSDMDPFIDEARTQLWQVVREYAGATRHGRRARLEVAFYEYGNGALLGRSGQVLPFTGDLDRVADHLFALTTQGGAECCGEVIQKASQELAWSQAPGDLRLVFIVGNGRFDQGSVDYRVAIAAAREKGIRINTIYAGYDEPSWREGARVAQGEYVTLDRDDPLAGIADRLDEQLAQLQLEQDEQACFPGVDELARMPFDQLPGDARLLTAFGLEIYVAEAIEKRDRLQARIDELTADRDAFAQPQGRGDAPVLEVVHDQGAQAGYRFE